ADDEMLRLAADAGFDAVVQVFSWREIEPRRGDWYWEYPDFLLRAAEYYDLDVIARLDQQPYWATKPEIESNSPPDNLDDYANFARAVAQRYRNRVKGYIIWNEPNLAREWGNRPPDAVAYTEMLCRAYRAIKSVDARALVVSAGLAPTNDQKAQALDDRVFLETLYRAGARECFDVLGVHAYGFGYPPDDPRSAHQDLNLARMLDLREMMQVYGDKDKPVWITELGWTTRGEGEHAWQAVSPQQQANYLVGAWQRIAREWNWVRVATIWNQSRGLPTTNEMAGYSLLNEDGKPKPAYNALRAELNTRWNQRLSRWVNSVMRAESSHVPILAADEIVHLGDND
ncbi:MAG: glycosyl hydrolase, partial [Anaerolineales bacterium]|nr:glycosyl hydrolase [Anaerolineales bacterium]